MVPLALVLAFDVLLVVILSRAQAVDFRLVSWRVDHQGISSIVRSCINNSRGMRLSLTLMCFFTVCIERQMIVPWSSHFMFVGSLLSWMDIVRMTSLRDECSISHMLLMLLLRKYHIQKLSPLDSLISGSIYPFYLIHFWGLCINSINSTGMKRIIIFHKILS